jgi:hypothetical protein
VRRIAVLIATAIVSGFLALTIPAHAPPPIWVLAAGVLGMLVANAAWRD